MSNCPDELEECDMKEEQKDIFQNLLDAHKCVYCGKSLNYLLCRSGCYQTFTLEQEDAEVECAYGDIEPDECSETTYECPQCLNVLFHDEDEAIAFLKIRKRKP